jgi:hypothetical protein
MGLFAFAALALTMLQSTSALVELSPVAFNEQATEALAYCGYTVSPIGGEGSLVRLRRTEAGTWVVVAWHQVWIS